MTASKYLLKIGTSLFGYDSLDILRIHLKENNVNKDFYTVYKNVSGLIMQYEETDLEIEIERAS